MLVSGVCTDDDQLWVAAACWLQQRAEAQQQRTLQSAGACAQRRLQQHPEPKPPPPTPPISLSAGLRAGSTRRGERAKRENRSLTRLQLATHMGNALENLGIAASG